MSAEAKWLSETFDWQLAQAERFLAETKAAALREAAAVWEDAGYFDPLGEDTPSWLKRRADALEQGVKP